LSCRLSSRTINLRCDKTARNAGPCRFALLRLQSFLNHEHINRLIFLFADTFVEDRREALRTGTAAFEFGYDWRRSLDESAIAFEAFVHRATRFLQVQRNSVRSCRGSYAKMLIERASISRCHGPTP
jgi:hypothetical protein